MKNFILQAVAEENHAAAVNNLLTSGKADKFIVSTAFMTEAGISLIDKALTPVADKTEFFWYPKRNHNGSIARGCP